MPITPIIVTGLVILVLSAFTGTKKTEDAVVFVPVTINQPQQGSILVPVLGVIILGGIAFILTGG